MLNRMFSFMFIAECLADRNDWTAGAKVCSIHSFTAVYPFQSGRSHLAPSGGDIKTTGCPAESLATADTQVAQGAGQQTIGTAT